LGVNPKLVQLVHLLDEAFQVPGTKFRIGLDGLLGLIPVAGDLSTLLLGFLVLREAQRLGLPRRKQALLVGNYLLDFLAGSIPLLGDLWDFGFKANKRNLKLIQKHLEHSRR
jgi:hypothetical protein